MSVRCRASLAWGWAFLSFFLHHTRSMDMCAVPPTIHVDTGVTAGAKILLRTSSFSGEACLQYCCTHGACSAALFSSANNTCYLFTCPSDSLCVGGHLPATTLYLISDNVQDEILHNEIRQLNSTTTTGAARTTTTLALTTGATTPTESSPSSNTKSATTAATTTSAAPTTASALQTPPPTQLTTQSTQANAETTTTTTSSVSSETLPSESQTNGISTSFSDHQSTSRVMESTLSIQSTEIIPDVTGSPNATDVASVTEEPSVTPPPGETTSQNTVTPPPLELSTTASVNASLGTGIVSGITNQQLTTESQASVGVLTSTLPSNEQSPTTPIAPQSNASTTVISTVPSQTSASDTTTSVVSGKTTVTSSNNTTSSTTGSQATDTTSSGTMGTTTATMLPASDSAESTESTVLVSVESTPLISANDSLADIAIEANDRAMSAALIAALSFGILFFAAVLVLLSKRLYDGWQRRHYSRVDYLVNGMYN